MKSYTDIEQSKKLAEILSLESADMCFNTNSMSPLMTPYSRFNEFFNMETPDFLIPCWSLAALLNVLPKRYYDDNVYMPYVGRYYEGNHKFICGYFGDGLFDWTIGETSVDACYEMILKLDDKML